MDWNPKTPTDQQAVVSHSPDPLPASCLHFILRKRQEGGLGAFPGDDVQFPLDLGEVVLRNRGKGLDTRD